MNNPSIFVIFGATGNLAAKKIIPSLWHLFRQGRLPARLAVIGFSRDNLSREEFKKLARQALLKHSDSEIIENDFLRFFENFSYQAGTFTKQNDFKQLFKKINEIESSWGLCANKLFYLAAPPSSYEAILKNLAAVKLNLACGGKLGWSRLLIEKPFGRDLKSAQELQSLLALYFTEEQIYRIDHYLFKEIVQGIESFRFSNNLFENTWDNTTIERIDLRLHEAIGVAERGSFYDTVGALRDVGQNHLLMMLAALTMEYAKNEAAGSTRQNRAIILETLLPWTKETIRHNTYRAQYRGYKQIKGVSLDSNTETYFALKTELAHQRWQGVPLFMEAGKRLAEARKEIVLTLKHPLVCHLCEIGPHEPNKIVFRLEPNNEIIINFWAKKPGFENAIEERAFSFFLYEKQTKAQYVEEYGKILYAAMAGKQTFFVSPEEVKNLWKFIDPVVKGWQGNLVPLAEYEPGATPGPSFTLVAPDNKDKKTQANTREIGLVGLGKMGANLATRLLTNGWRVIGLDHFSLTTKKLEKDGIIGAYSSEELVKKLSAPRLIWLMVPAGQPVDQVIFGKDGLARLLMPGDIIIDGGNSFYKDSIARFKKLKKLGIYFIDVGVSGGPQGASTGACLMIGGELKIFEKLEPLFYDLAAPASYQFFPGAGAGHFVKMVHNGIEYGMMQALAEGFTILKKSKYKIDLARVADVYNHGSVIESRLVGWLKNALEIYGHDLKKISGSVGQTGEGEWTVTTAKEMKLKVKIIAEALKFRKQSLKKPSYTGKILSALRGQFGGHEIINKHKI
ncbi:MAG: glucose-6-phosphate dehydrogenase [Parcubacteria group bacterium]|nr:glucose-6-phosphate dehydrogenase [Parcubacteria group bacterium]